MVGKVAERCFEKLEGCPYKGKRCIISRHHIYWPAADYGTPVEAEFRNLEENISLLPRCTHDLLHDEINPPPKPSLLEMLKAISRQQDGN